jgi:hypothetical protein
MGKTYRREHGHLLNIHKVNTTYNDATHKYRENFYSLDEFTALHLTAAGAPPAMRCIRILPMNKLITYGMKGSN